MPRGGRRVGSGRKPGKGKTLAFPGGGATGHAPAPAADVAVLAEPPADLPPALAVAIAGMTPLTSQADLWRRYAPSAIEQRTLIPATVAGFRELVELAAFKEEMAARIARFGSDGKSGSERMRTYTRLSQRLDAALARFKLTAFGKPADGGAKKPVATNPWAKVGG